MPELTELLSLGFFALILDFYQVLVPGVPFHQGFAALQAHFSCLLAASSSQPRY